MNRITRRVHIVVFKGQNPLKTHPNLDPERFDESLQALAESLAGPLPGVNWDALACFYIDQAV